MPVPKPGKDEDKDKYMARCMHEVSKNPDRTNEQNVAICMQAWRDKDKKEEPRQEFIKALEHIGDFIKEGGK